MLISEKEIRLRNTMVFISSHLKIVGFPTGECFQVYEGTKKMKDILPMTEQKRGDIRFFIGG